MLMKIEIIKLSGSKITEKNILQWPIWTCEVSEFDWEYSDEEACLLLEGEVEVSSEFETVRFSQRTEMPLESCQAGTKTLLF